MQTIRWANCKEEFIRDSSNSYWTRLILLHRITSQTLTEIGPVLPQGLRQESICSRKTHEKHQDERTLKYMHKIVLYLFYKSIQQMLDEVDLSCQEHTNLG